MNRIVIVEAFHGILLNGFFQAERGRKVISVDDCLHIQPMLKGQLDRLV